MKILKFRMKLLILSVISITFLLSCENDTTDIGGDLIPDKSQGNKTYVDLIAYSISNDDSIRSDRSSLNRGLVGLYEDGVFGKSKASFNTQIRLSTGDAINGTIQQVDSVVLGIYPNYDSSNPLVREEVISQGETSNDDQIKYITNYPLSSFLGSKNITMKLNVNRVEDFLESIESKFYSNQPVNFGDLLGTANIGTSITTVSIRTRGGTTIQEATTPGYRIKLDPEYFKQQFIDKKGSLELTDNSQFIRYFKGLRITPDETSSKFMFNFPINTMTLTIYYRYKNNAEEANFTNASYSFDLASAFNSVKGEYTFDRSTASSQFNQQMLNPNKTQGEALLFLQGMGGPNINLKLDDNQLVAIKDSVQNKKWAIVGANLKFYLTQIPESKPSTIYGYDGIANSFLPDVNQFSSLPGYSFNPPYDNNNPGYYTLNVTQYVKNIVEKNDPNNNIIVGMGDFLRNSSSQYIGYNISNRVSEPYRLSFFGNNTNDNKKLRLEILYTKN